MLLCLSFACLTTGCSNGYRNYPAPVLDPPPSAGVQNQAIQIVQQFVADLNRKDYPSADNLLTAALRNDWSPSNAQRHLVKDGYWMLVGSHDWKYNQVQSLKHGKEVVVHAQFYNDPKNMLYHTNFSLAKQGEAWQIDFILNPVQKTRLVSVKVAVPMRRQ
jgi:hypothetical protein